MAYALHILSTSQSCVFPNEFLSETVDGGFAYWAIFWISIDKQHPRTCNLVLHICDASDCLGLVIAAVDK